MKKQLKFGCTPIITGSAWCIWGIVICVIPQKTILPIVLSHIAFFIFFISTTILLYLNIKNQSIKDEKWGKYKRKKKWEKFQYNLNKIDRDEKANYEQLNKLLDKLKNKEIVDNEHLKNEIKELDKKIENYKEKKEKQIFIEINKKLDDTINHINK